MKARAVAAEGRRLLNPAFVAMCVAAAAAGYGEVAGAGVPLPFCYIIVPLVLHEETRVKLPRSPVTKLLSWTEKNGDLVARLGKRLPELQPFVSEGVLVAVTSSLAELSKDVRIVAVSDLRELQKQADKSGSREVSEIIKKASFCGRWFAAAGTPATVLTAMGVILENDAA